jgi:hypothetical protein
MCCTVKFAGICAYLKGCSFCPWFMRRYVIIDFRRSYNLFSLSRFVELLSVWTIAEFAEKITCLVSNVFYQLPLRNNAAIIQACYE